MKALLRQARRLARAGGLPGIIAAGLLAFTVAVLLSSVAPLLERTRQAQVERQRLAALQSEAGGGGRAVASTPAERLTEFYLFFGRTDERTDTLERIHKLARDQKLEVLQGNYRLGGGTDRLARYELSLPLRGAYPQIRAFVATVLNEVPSAALEQISFEKQKIGDPAVEAQLKLVLFLDTAPRPAR